MFKFLKAVSPLILTACAMVLIIGGVAHIINRTPDVIYSQSTNECVYVVVKGKFLDCSYMPEKYNKRWVK